MPQPHHKTRPVAAKKQQRRLWSWAATLVGGVPSAPSKVAGCSPSCIPDYPEYREFSPTAQMSAISSTSKGCVASTAPHPLDVSRFHFYSGRHGTLSLTSLYCPLLAGLKGTGLMPVAVASLLLGQLHHKPSECEVVVAHPILTVSPTSRTAFTRRLMGVGLVTDTWLT